MQDKNVVLGLELINAKPSGIEELKSEANGEDDLSFLMLDGANGDADRYFLAPINDQSSEILEQSADELGVENTLIKPTVIDLVEGSVKVAAKITEAFIDNTDDVEEQPDGSFTLASMFDIFDFINDNPQIVEQEINDVNSRSKENNTTNDESSSQRTLAKEGQDTEVTTGQTISGDTSSNGIEPPEDQGEKDDTGIEHLFDSMENQDPVYQEAVRRVNDAIQFSLPTFDEQTQRELQPYIFEMENGFAVVKDNVVQRIYEKLSKIQAETEENVEKVNIEPARQAHESAIQTLQANQDIDLKKTIKIKNEEYKENKQAFIKASIPAIEEEFDSNHLEKHMAVVEEAKKVIKAEYDQQIATENEKFDDYVDSVKTMSVQQAWDQVSVDEPLIELKEFLQDQLKIIKERAGQFHGQVENATKELSEELTKVKSELKESEQNNRTLQNTIDERVKAQTEQKVSEEIHKLDDTIEQYKTKAERFQSKYQEADDYNEELKQKLKHQERNFRQEITDLQKKMLDLTQNSNSTSTTENTAQHPQKSFVENINKYAGILTLLIVFVFGAFWFGKSTNNNQQAQAAVPTVTEVSPSTSGKSSNSKLKKGETFSYRTKSGKNVQVIVDSAHAGHYIDDKGKVHSVIF